MHVFAPILESCLWLFRMPESSDWLPSSVSVVKAPDLLQKLGHQFFALVRWGVGSIVVPVYSWEEAE